MDDIGLPKCESWPLDPSCLPETWPTDPEVVAVLVEKATTIAHAMSARRVGRCRYTVRPCRDETRDPCDGPCGCGPICRVTIGDGDISCVEEVWIDGAKIPRSGWKFYNHRVVMLTGGRCFPGCQRLDLDLTEPGTWGVRYLVGQKPDSLASSAMTAIAVELARECAISCDVPMQNLTSMTVDGATYTFDPGGSGGFYGGLPQVDAWLDVVNPYRRRRRPVVVSPDDDMLWYESGTVHYT